MKPICRGLLALALGLLAVSQVGADWNHPDWIRGGSRAYPPSRSVWGSIGGGGSGGSRSRVTYTAIAYSASLGRQGWAKNYSTIRAAQLAAMRTCGGRDVRPIIWGASGSYVALAVGDKGAAGATGRTAAQARENALRECRRHTTNCKVYVIVYAP